MKKLKAKLNSHSGETLAEVLVALLVSALAIVMLASMISSSVNIISKSRDRMKDYYEQTKFVTPTADKTATVSVKQGSEQVQSFNVYYYSEGVGSEDVISYVLAPGT